MALQVQPLQNVGNINGVSTLPKPQSLSVKKLPVQPTLKMASPTPQAPLSVKPLANQPVLNPNVIDATGQKASPYLGTPQEHTVSDLGWRIKQKYPDYADLSDEELGAKMKAKFPDYSDFQDAPQPKEPGLGQKIIQTIANPFLRVGVSLAGAVRAAKNAIESSIAYHRGDAEGYYRNLAEGNYAGRSEARDLGYFGKVKPIGQGAQEEVTVGSSFNTAKDITGLGAELASYAVGGGGVKNIVKAGLKGAVKQGAIQGGKAGLQAGLLGGFGTSMQEDDATIGSVAKSTLLGGLGGLLTGGALGGLTGGAGAGVKAIRNKVFDDIGKQVDEAIVQGVERGVKPSVSGKKTTTQYNNFLDRSKLAVKYITESRDELGLKNLPKTLDEFSEAIGKAKNSVFSKYNYLSETAGTGKAKVYLEPVVKELRGVANDPILGDMAPSVAQYADDLANNYAKRGSYTTAEAQRAIELFNSKLKAFYKNPNPEMANKIYIESMVVNNLRKLQDNTIQNATGQNYQALKNVYGALADLEKEVSHRAVVVGRQNLKGLADLSDIFTGGQIVEGILNGSPIQITKGLIGKTISTTYKALNNPDRLVAQMFKKVGKLADKANKKGIRLTPNSELKTMLSLPEPYANARKGRLPTINLSPIEMPKKSQTSLDIQELSKMIKSRKIKPKYTPSGGQITQIFPSD